MNKPLLYPIGEQDFANIRNRGMLYVDKTALIHQLVNSGSYIFLSRPVRLLAINIGRDSRTIDDWLCE